MLFSFDDLLSPSKWTARLISIGIVSCLALGIHVSCTSSSEGNPPAPAPTPDFSLQVLPGSLSLAAGATGSVTVSAQRTNGHSDAISLTADNPPTGVTASGSITSGSTSGSFSILVASGVSPQTFSLTVRGVSGSLTRTATLFLVVTVPPTPDFALTVVPPSTPPCISAGSSGSITVQVTRTNGHDKPILLGCQANSQGILCTGNIAANVSSGTLTIDVPSSVTAGTFSLIASANDGTLTRTAGFSQCVSNASTPPVITQQPQAVTVDSGQAAEFRVVATGATEFLWQVSRDGGSTWTNQAALPSDATRLQFAAAYFPDDGTLVRVQVRNPGTSVTSLAVRLTVNPFFNRIGLPITRPTNPAAPPSMVIRRVDIRQLGTYVQFAWEAAADPSQAPANTSFWLTFDVDSSSQTGLAIDGELGVEVAVLATPTQAWLITWAINGVEVSRTKLPILFEGNRFHVSVPRTLLAFNTARFKPRCFAGSVNSEGNIITVELLPTQPEVRLVVESNQTVLREKPTLIQIPDKAIPVQLHVSLIGGTAPRPITSGLYVSMASAPGLSDPGSPNYTVPSSLISVDEQLCARYLKEGFVYLSIWDSSTWLRSETAIVATGRAYGDPNRDEVLAVWPADYAPPGSAFTFGNMMTNWPDYIRTVSAQYRLTSELYRGYKPFNADRQVFAMWVPSPGYPYAHPGNPLETPPKMYMNIGDGSPQYIVVHHEMGHNFQNAWGMRQLFSASSHRLGKAGAAEGIASLPVQYFAYTMVFHPGSLGFSVGSKEWSWYKAFFDQDAGSRQALEGFEQKIAAGTISGFFDPKHTDGVAVFCSWFQAYLYGFAHGQSQYGAEIYRRFLNIFDDRALPGFQESKVETYFVAGFSAAVGSDMRVHFRRWGFTVDDAYYQEVEPGFEMA